MFTIRCRLLAAVALVALFSALWPRASEALSSLRFEIAGGDRALNQALVGASQLRAMRDDKGLSARQILAAALSDYANLVRTLYENGHYGGVVSILLDGREAAEIPLLAIPGQIASATVRIDPGPPFRFGSVGIAPLPPNTRLPAGFAPGQPALSGTVRGAVEAAVDGWRAVGHARAAPVGQKVVADHAAGTLSAHVRVDPGPLVRFGALRIASPSAVRAARIRAIAGLRGGHTFSPAELERVAARLRRSGAFSSVSLAEAETLDPGDRMDILLRVVDERPRRFGFGAEIASLDGLKLSGFWMHRNAFGGAERFRIEGEARGLGGGTGGNDYELTARLDVPAVAGPDIALFVSGSAAHLDEPDYLTDRASLSLGLSRRFSERLTGEIAVGVSTATATDANGTRGYSMASVPGSLVWDRRDDPLSPASGFYIATEVTPFLGFSGTASGLRATLDARAYRALNRAGGVVLAGRVQLGSVLGPGIAQTRPDFLFHSGGGGTVRGQPYQSLGVVQPGGATTGGKSLLALSLEARIPVTGQFGAVAFFDAAHVGKTGQPGSAGLWHSGAGLGLRYRTALGPIRLDVALPTSGGSGSGVQVYLGIGQAF